MFEAPDRAAEFLGLFSAVAIVWLLICLIAFLVFPQPLNGPSVESYGKNAAEIHAVTPDGPIIIYRNYTAEMLSGEEE